MTIDSLGILGNIVATMIIFFAGMTWKSVISPWVSKVTYRGTKIHGAWHGEQDLPHAIYRFEIRLEQFGPKVKGKFISNDTYKLPNGIPNNIGSQEYSVAGLVQDGFVFLQYEATSPNTLGIGGFLFSIESRGSELEGHMLFLRSRSAESIGTTSTLIQLRRK